MQLGYAGTTTNLPIVLNTKKNAFLNQATQKNTCQFFPPTKNPRIENSNPKKSFKEIWSAALGEGGWLDE